MLIFLVIFLYKKFYNTFTFFCGIFCTNLQRKLHRYCIFSEQF